MALPWMAELLPCIWFPATVMAQEAVPPPGARRLKRPRGVIRTRSSPGLLSGALPAPLLTDNSDNDDGLVDDNTPLGPPIRRRNSMPRLRSTDTWPLRFLIRWSWTRAGKEADRFYSGW